jgi:hypothetical protein
VKDQRRDVPHDRRGPPKLLAQKAPAGIGCPTAKPFPHLKKHSRNKPGLTLLCRPTRISVMWTLIEDLYRDYCLTRLNEIRGYELSH